LARSLLTFCRVTESKSQRSAFPRPKLKGPEQTKVSFILDSSLSLLLQCFPDLANNIVTFSVRIWGLSTYSSARFPFSHSIRVVADMKPTIPLSFESDFNVLTAFDFAVRKVCDAAHNLTYGFS